MKPILPIAAAIAFTATFLRTTKSSSSTARKIVTRAASTSSGGNEAVTKKNIPKPICKRINHDVSFGVVTGENRGEDAMDPPIKVNDDLFWLRDDERKNEEILAYLKTENDYTEAHTKHLKKKETELYNEIVKAIEETDVDVKFPWGENFEYYVRTVKGKSYPIVCRQERTNTAKGGDETVVLDVNDLAKQMSYCSIGGFNMSESHNLLAYGVDETGYETYRIKVRNVKTGKRCRWTFSRAPPVRSLGMATLNYFIRLWTMRTDLIKSGDITSALLSLRMSVYFQKTTSYTTSASVKATMATFSFSKANPRKPTKFGSSI